MDLEKFGQESAPNVLEIKLTRGQLAADGHIGVPFNPYVTIECDGAQYDSDAKNKTYTPEWNQTFIFPITEQSSTVTFLIQHKQARVWKDPEFKGQARLSLFEVSDAGGDHLSKWLDVCDQTWEVSAPARPPPRAQ